MIDYESYGLSKQQITMLKALKNGYSKALPVGYKIVQDYIEYLLDFEYHTKPSNFIDRKDVVLTEIERKALTYVLNRAILYDLKHKVQQTELFIDVTENPQKALDAGMSEVELKNCCCRKYTSLYSPEWTELQQNSYLFQNLLMLMCFTIVFPNSTEQYRINSFDLLNRINELNFDDNVILQDCKKPDGYFRNCMIQISCFDISRIIFQKD